MTLKCRKYLHEACFNSSQDHSSYNTSGEILTRMGQDMSTVSTFLGTDIPVIVSTVVNFILIVIYLSTLEPFLLCLCMATIPLLVVMTTIFTKGLVLTKMSLSLANDELLNCLHETLRASQYIQARNTYKQTKKHFYKLANHFRKISVASTVLESRYSGYSTTIYSLTSVTILILGVAFVKLGRLTPGGVIAFSSCFGLLVSPVNTIILSWVRFKQFMVSLERLDEYIAPYYFEMQSGKKNPVKTKTEIADGVLQISEISFCYRDATAKPILNRLNFKFEPGQIIAILGESGAGKSTLCRLLAGNLRPTSGQVLLGGINVSENIESHRDSISYLPQEPVIFNDTIYNNLTYGCQRPTNSDRDIFDRHIEDAVELLGLKSFVEGHPAGYRTVLEKGETEISGGQKQRICLISVILKDAGYYLLDEPSNSLDKKNVSQLIRVIKSLKNNGKGVIIFTHDKRFLACCDYVYSLKDGKLIAELNFGRHTEF
jgi:ABC-type bacteriocin/lantibiotic exporter with double-glycine peptidase domain